MRPNSPRKVLTEFAKNGAWTESTNPARIPLLFLMTCEADPDGYRRII
jgi:hypothetical protein